MIIGASVWWLAVVPAGASAALLYSLAFPAGNSGPLLLGAALWAVVAAVWLLRLVWRRTRLLLVTVLLAALTAGLALLDTPLRVAFALGRTGLDRQVATGTPGRAWIYEVAAVERREGTDATFLRIAGTGGPFYDETGFLHAPSGPPAPSGARALARYRSLGGAWYWYEVPTRAQPRRNPPSALRSWPDIHRPSSDTSQATSRAASSGSP